ncbi:MAG: PAS domain-containing protein [Rhizobium sp.]|nr:PAS domain-containing protein [Rhizobium sp.]
MAVTLVLGGAAFWCLYELVTISLATDGMAAAMWALLAVVVCGALCAASLDHVLLRRLRVSLLRAREGLLDDVEVPPGSVSALGRIVREYNTTIGALRSMFRMVEECQGRFLNQRNSMNTILQHVPGALLSLSNDLQVVMANKQAEELFGTAPDGLIGRNLFDLLLLEEPDRELLRDSFLYKQPIRNEEIHLTTNTEQHFSLNLGFYSDEDADMGGVLILQDVSEYRRLQDSVAMREKLVAMGQLAAGVAHELNTPLGNILGYSQLLGQTFGAEGQSAQYLQTISEEAKRCSRIVHDLLNFARADRCNGDVCDVDQLIRELIDTFLNCRLRRYNIDVRLNLEKKPLVVEGSCGQLDIVLTNLIANAIHALDGVNQPVIEVSSWQDGDHAMIGVADNGPGVPKGFRKRIFDPFFTTKDVGQGSGLGLPICHAIVARRGGHIYYDDSFTAGARFLIRLPAVNMRRAGLMAFEEAAV